MGVKRPGIGGGVGARRAADGGLVNADHFVEKVDALDGIVRAGLFVRTVDLLGQCAVEDLVDQGGFSAARNSGNDGEQAERDIGIDLFEIVLAGSADGQPFAVALAARRGHGNALRAAEVAAGERCRGAFDFGRSAAGHQFSAEAAGAGTEIDDVIGALDGFGVVLHHEHGIAHVAQVGEGFEQAIVVAGMQADGRLVEHVEHAAQFGTDLGGQTDALRLAAGEGGGGAVDAEIVEADGGEKFEAAADFVDDAPGDLLLAIGEFPIAHRHEGARNRQAGEFADGEILHAHGEAGGTKALAVAGGALGGRHVIGEPLAIGFGGRLVGFVQDGEDAGQAAGAFHQGFARLLRQLFEGLGQVDAGLSGECLQLLLHLPGARAWAQAAIEERLGGIHDHLGGVEGPFAAEAMTFLAGSVGTVERDGLEAGVSGASPEAG